MNLTCSYHNTLGQMGSTVRSREAHGASQRVADVLVRCRPGRMLLHAICLCRRPAQAHWHWLGLWREVSGH